MRLKYYLVYPGILTVATAISEPGYSDRTARSSYDCCRILKSETDLDAIFVPGDEDYVSRVDSYFSVTSRLTPKCFVLPRNTIEVAEVVKTLVQQTECKFAVKSGGHSSTPGANNIEEGVTIDLGLLRGVEYHDDTSLASILPGTDWQSVYEYLDVINKGVSGGRQGEVGVGGFLLGGGFSHYLYRDGMSCDNIRQFEVVLANGTIVEANADQHVDLFKVLKGGGSNFGIVTRFDVQAFDTRPIWRSAKNYKEDAGESMIGALKRFTDAIEGYQNGSAVVSWNYIPANGEIRISNSLNDVSGVEAHPVYEELYSIPGEVSGMVEWTNMSKLALENLPRGYRYIWWSLTMDNDEKLIAKMTELHHNLVEEIKDQSPDGDFETLLFFQPFPAYLGSSENILGIDRHTQNAIVCLFSLAVNGKDQERVARKKSFSMKREFEKFASREENGLLDFVYINYASGLQDVVETYGSDNVCLMWEVSKRVDPDGVFQNRQPGGFKLPDIDC